MARTSLSDDWRRYDSVASAYNHLVTHRFAPPAEALVALVSPASGDSVLDIGTGTGLAASRARQRVAPRGVVIGLDRSSEMLRFARRHGATAVIGDASSLPFTYGSFDAAMASFVLSHLQHPVGALKGILRVLRRGGRFGATAWAEKSQSPSELWAEVARRFLPPSEMERAGSAVPHEQRFRFPANLLAIFEDAGFTKVLVDERSYPVRVSVERYVEERCVGSIGRFLRSRLGDDVWTHLKQEAVSAYRERFGADLEFTDDVLIAMGTRA